MNNKDLYDQGKAIFRYAESSPDRENDPWYFECLDTFLAFSSFLFNDNSLFPYWSNEINCESIIELSMEVNSDCLTFVERRFLCEVMYFYIQNRGKLWEFVDGLNWYQRDTLISVFVSEKEKQQFINKEAYFRRKPNQAISQFYGFTKQLSDCSEYQNYVASKYKIG